MTVEYACVFGIASGIKCLGDGDQVNAFLDGAAVLMIQGKGDRTFWFLFKKLDQKYVYPDAPRFSMDDAKKLCSEMKDVRLYQELCVGDLWRNKQIAAMTALEEGLFKTWFYDRMVLLGDSVHKVSQSFLPGHGVLFAKANNDCHQMTPNFGQGANCAIEDAAALASLLQTLLCGNPTQQPSLVQIRNTLQAYQDKRYPRVRGIYDDSWTVCRIHSRDGLLNKLVGRYYTQWNTSLPANIASKVFVGGETLSFLPVPVRPGRGWQSRSRSGKYGFWSYAVLFVFIAMLAQGFISFSDELLFLE